MLRLRSLGQLVGRDQGVTGLFESGEQLKCLFESELDHCRRFTIRRILHDPRLSRGCISFLPGLKPPVPVGTRTCTSVLHPEPSRTG